jgi:RHS repeat-associated protein
VEVSLDNATHLSVSSTFSEASYYRARYYDQNVGRFLSEDPIRYGGGISIYNYVGGNPIIYTDPSGNRKVYGNWCGPNWTGGRKEPYDPAHDPLYKPPIDALDTVCMNHDKCYYLCRRDHPCSKGDRQNCMRICDQTLIRDVPDTKWGKIVADGIKWFNKNPNAGDNAPSCACQ